MYDSGEADGVPFYVMPCVEGESLRGRLRRNGPLPIRDVLQIVSDVAAALEYAHARQIVHRDVKPENILLTGGRALVTDFGIARAMTTGATGLTDAGLLIGTPHYMAPEQIAGDEELDGRVDVYALGSVAYEMLTGKPPFTGPTVRDVLLRRLADPAPGVRHLRAEATHEIERALRKALARLPADRFGSARAFADALIEPPRPAPLVPLVPRSVAVLPFLNLSADPDNEYVADGITEDVIAQLAKLAALKVISRTSVMAFKGRARNLRDIGARLGVSTILEGSVRRAGSRIRIVAQLIDVSTDQHLWVETYDRELTEIFDIQRDVALHIAAALKAELSSDERRRLAKKPTPDLEAYQLYLKGRQHLLRFTEDGLRSAMVCFRRATARDPAFAPAFAGLGLAWVIAGMGHGAGATDSREAYSRARTAIDRALALDDGLGEAHALRAFVAALADFDWAAAEAGFEHAIGVSPGSAEIYAMQGVVVRALGRYHEAARSHMRARELDPLAPVAWSDLATTLLRAGRVDEALQEARGLVEIEPEFPLGHGVLGWALIKQGNHADGLAELERAVSLSPGNTMLLGQLAHAYAVTGRPGEARRLLKELRDAARVRYVSPYHLAYVHAGLGEVNAALACLEQAYAERSGGVYGIKGSFLFDALRAHAGLAALLRKMNLDEAPPQATAEGEDPTGDAVVRV